MKTPPIQMWQFAPFLAAFCLPSLVIAQESNLTPTGTPTPPVIDVNSPDVKNTRIYDLGDRRMIVQEVTEATLPLLRPEPAKESSLPPEALSAGEGGGPEPVEFHTLIFGGTVHRSATGALRSLITLWQPHAAGPLVFWSSIDWSLLTVGGFTTPEGAAYSMLILLTELDTIQSSEALAGDTADETPPPPTFTGTAASFKIVSGTPTEETLAELSAIHAFHDREHAALLAEKIKRDEARRLAKEAAKLPQPPPPDIIIQGRPMTPEELAPYRSKFSLPAKP